jgi:hypothetical protein
MKNIHYIFGFDRQQLASWFLYWLVLGVGLIVLVFLITGTWIGVEVKQHCLAATSHYQGDCVEALTHMVDDEQASYRERNYAIWSLGQLGDQRARATLEKHYTGNIPAREPYDDGLSQYEMRKALKLVDGGLNLTHLLWNPQDVEW